MRRPASASAQAQSHRPATAARLLRLLGIPHACAQHQQTALAQWLACNTPTRELKLSLRANGYGILLPRPRRLRSQAG
jgi:hypothetical protein